MGVVFRSTCRFGLAALLLGLPRGAHAEPSEAERRTTAKALFDRAVELQKKGDFASACPKFEEANRVDPRRIGVLVALAECYEEAGKLASAKAAYEIAERAALAATDPRAAGARTKIESLAPRVPQLTIVVPANVRTISGLAIKRDEIAVGAAQWGDPLPIDPGRHVIAATAPGKKRWTKTVDAAISASATVELPLLEDDTAPPQNAAADRTPPHTGVRPWVWAVGGTGLALLGVAAGFGVDGLNAKSTLVEKCGAASGTCSLPVSVYDPAEDNARKNRGLGVFIGVGGAGLLAVGAAVIGIAMAPRAPSSSTAIRVLPVFGTRGGGAMVGGEF